AADARDAGGVGAGVPVVSAVRRDVAGLAVRGGAHAADPTHAGGRRTRVGIVRAVGRRVAGLAAGDRGVAAAVDAVARVGRTGVAVVAERALVDRAVAIVVLAVTELGA